METTTGGALPSADRAKLLAMIREALELPPNHPLDEGTHLRDLPDVDSLKVMRLLGEAEFAFFIHLGFQAVHAVETVGDFCEVINAACAQKLASAADRGPRDDAAASG